MRNFKFWWIVLILAAIFCGLISIIPHFHFNTNAFDLGIFNQTLRQYAHFQLDPNTIREVPILFADHMEILLLFFSPLYWIFGSYTLLIIQIAAVLFGAYGVYVLLKDETRKESLSIFGMVIFLLFFGLVSAMAFDYHNNVVGTMFIPWIFYAIKRKKFAWYYLLLALLLFSKENMALLAAFIGLSTLIFEKRELRIHGFITLIVSAIYFVVALKLIAYFNSGIYPHWEYAALGDSPGEAIKTIFFHPLDTLFLIFDDPVKIKMWVLLLLSGGILAVLQPKYAILLIPVIAQKFFSSKPEFWGFSHHYAVEFAPIIAIGAALAIHKLIPGKCQKYLIGAVVGFNFLILTQIHFYNGENVFRIFSPDYYKNKPEYSATREVLKLVKDAESVSAQNTLTPHLKNKVINLFPKIDGSEYIILNTKTSNTWPLKNPQEVKENLNLINQNNSYEKIFEKEGLYLFRQKNTVES